MILKRNVFAYLSASIIERGLGLLGSSFAMRRNPEVLFGIFSHLRTLPVSAVPFASLGLENAVARAHSRPDKSPFLTAIFAIWIAVAAGVSAVAGPVTRFYMGEEFFLAADLPTGLLRMLMFSNIMLSVSIAAFIVMERGRLAASLTSAIAVISFASLATFGFSHSIVHSIWVYALGSSFLLLALTAYRFRTIAMAAGALLQHIRRSRGGFWPLLLADFRFCLPFAAASWIAILANRASAMVFSNAQDGTGLAFANLALNIASLTQVFGWALNNSENPKVLNGLLAAGTPSQDHLDRAFRKLSEASHLAVIGCCLSVFVAVLYALFSTSKWNGSVPLFSYIVFFSILKFLFDVVGTFLQYDFLYIRGKLGYATLAKTSLLFIQIPLLGFLAAEFGIKGALAGYLLTSALNFLPGEFFLGREFLARRLAVYGRHLLALSPFLMLIMAQSKTSLVVLAGIAGLFSAAADFRLSPADFRARMATKALSAIGLPRKGTDKHHPPA